MTTPIRAPVVRCTQRCAGTNLSSCSRARSGRVLVIASVRPSHPGVDVVAVLLPEPRLHLVDDLDAAEPLHRLVAVHRGDVEPHRTAVVAADRLAEHLQGDEDVGPTGLVEGEAVGVRTV